MDEGGRSDESGHGRRITQFIQEELSGEEQQKLLSKYNTDAGFRNQVDQHHSKYNKQLICEAQEILEKIMVDSDSCKEPSNVSIENMWLNVVKNIERT